MALMVSGVGIAFVSAIGANPSLSGPPSVSSTISQTTSASTTTTTSSVSVNGTLSAEISVGPTQPVCYAYAPSGPAPSYFASIEILTTDPAGQTTAYPVDWVSNGCYVTGSLSVSLAPGSYSLALSSCNWMGCRAALPRQFVIYEGLSDVDVPINTGMA